MLMATWLNAVRGRFRRSSKQARRPQTQRHWLSRVGQLEALESRLYLAAVAWDAGGDGVHWSDANNWSSEVLLGAADDVTLNFGSGTVQLDMGTDTVNSLTTTNPFELARSTLSVVTTTQVNNSFTINGGTIGSTGITRREKECCRDFSPSAFQRDTLRPNFLVTRSES